MKRCLSPRFYSGFFRRRAGRTWSRPATLATAMLLSTTALAQGPDETLPVGQSCDSGYAVAAGTCFSAEALVDGFANLRGGVRHGVAALTQLKLGLRTDLGEVLPGLEGWALGTSAFAIYGRQPTPTLTGSLAPASNAEALSTVRLSELWLERDLDSLGSIRFGQLAADAEFMTAAAAGGLVNGTFGWPLALSTALPSGGPAYPFAAPGVRLAFGDPDEGNGLRLGVFSGDPSGRSGAGTDPQRHNRYGTNFSFNGGALYMAEGVVGATAPEKGAPRPWLAKLGTWYHTGGFDDQRRDVGVLLGGPASSGVLQDSEAPVRRRRSNYGVYSLGETTLWRGEDASVAVFARVSATPGGRNLLDFYADSGLAWRGPFGRAGDTASLGIGYAKVGEPGRDLDRALRAGGTILPVRDREVVLEVNYEAQLVPDRLYVRPGVQWISHPAAGIPDERYSTDARLRDALVAGVRVRAVF